MTFLIVFFFICNVLCVCIAGNCSPVSVVAPYERRVNASVGDTAVTIVTFENGVFPFDLSFLNLHQNENTSVVAAKTLIAATSFRASITYIEHGGTRELCFELRRTHYCVDPNRMFTPAGRKRFLTPYSAEADAAVAEFAKTLLTEYRFFDQRLVVALHNNGPNFSATDYLPGGPFAQDAQAVVIGTLFDPREFTYVVPGPIGTPLFNCLGKSNLNAVLQAPLNGTLDDDGSLSVYSAMTNKSYINVEAAAESGGSGDAIVNQLLNLRAILELVKQIMQ